MHSYAAYNLRLRSAFELPELPVVDAARNHFDVDVVRGDIDSVPESVDGVGGRRIQADPDVVRLTYDSIGSFLVEDGDRIVCDPVDEAAEQGEFFRRLIENELLGLVLHQRDHLVLHASAVSVDRRAVLFLGPRGAGKSTTAAAFDASGYSVLEDDVVAIRFDESGPAVVPGVPQLRLESDAATALDLQGLTTPSEESWYEKHMLPIDDVPDAAPLARCYVLTDDDRVEIHQLPVPEQLLNLIAQRYARGLTSETERPNVHMEQCSRIVEHAGVRVLNRPLDHNRLPELVDVVADDIRQSKCGER